MLHLCATALLTMTTGPAAPPPTIVPPMFYSEILKASQQIVTGTVVGSTCRYERGKETIVTLVTFANLTVHKGKVDKKFTLRFEGGSMGDDHLKVALVPQFKVGSRYLLYIDDLSGKKISPIVGFHQGAFEVKNVNGREVLLNTFGQELIGIRKDRFVFAAKPAPAKIGRAPQAVDAKSGIKPAHPNVEAMELAQKAKDDAKARAAQEATKIPVITAGGVDVKGPDSVPATTQKPIMPRKNAAPLVVSASSDTGIRMSTQSLLTINGEVK
jgi:hypothetical protein